VERASRHHYPAGVDDAVGGVRFQSAGVGNDSGHAGVGQDRERVPVGVAGEAVGDLVLSRVAVRDAGEVLARQAVIAGRGEELQ
jgi:hypothetical protein